MNDTVIITIRWQKQLNVDLQIPLDMYFDQLIHELTDIYDELPAQQYGVYLVTKNVVLNNLHCSLKQCHVSNGDILRLMEAANDNEDDLSI